MGVYLSLAVAAKGQYNPQPFMDALMADGILSTANVDIHIAFDNVWPIDSSMMPQNVFLHPCPSGTSILKLWGLALASSTGNYVAVLDINCPPSIGWLISVESEIGRGNQLFFGPVDPGWEANDRRIVGYLAEYAQFSSPLDSDLCEVPGNNLVCKRPLLGDMGKLRAEGLFKTFMVWRLENEQKLKPGRLDTMVVKYQKPFQYWHYIKRRYIHGRCFGSTRHDNPDQPPRVFCFMFAVFLPILRTWRIYRVVRYRSDLKKAFHRYILLVISSEFAWSTGELLGYALGGRDYCNKLD
jgi:hypothetical protein